MIESNDKTYQPNRRATSVLKQQRSILIEIMGLPSPEREQFMRILCRRFIASDDLNKKQIGDN